MYSGTPGTLGRAPGGICTVPACGSVTPPTVVPAVFVTADEGLERNWASWSNVAPDPTSSERVTVLVERGGGTCGGVMPGSDGRAVAGGVMPGSGGRLVERGFGAVRDGV